MIQNKIELLIQLLTTAYNNFNKELFKDELPDVIINIDYINPPKNKKGLIVHGCMCANGAFVDSDGNYADSITINPRTIKLGFEQTMLTLLHEMIHIYNKMLYIEDVQKNGKHKKEFKEAAEIFGVPVEKDNSLGWTTPCLSLEHYTIVSSIEYDTNIFDLDYELTELDKDKNDKPKKSKFKHYCPNGHNKPFKLSEPQENLKCSICGASLIIEEEQPKNK